MKHFVLVVILFLFASCSTSITKKELSQLNGYWEIAEVKFNDGQKKSYNVNTSIDYIQLNEMKGSKKKVQPKLDGSFITTKDAESFTIVEKNEAFYLIHKNALSEWEEKLVSLEENMFSITNEAKITYTYKRYEPISLE